MAKRKQHRHSLTDLLRRYAASRNLDIHTFNKGSQIRLTDNGYIAVDVWLTGKYHISRSHYNLLTTIRPLRFRQGERGELPIERAELGRFLDLVFFYADIINERTKIK